MATNRNIQSIQSIEDMLKIIKDCAAKGVASGDIMPLHEFFNPERCSAAIMADEASPTPCMPVALMCAIRHDRIWVNRLSFRPKTASEDFGEYLRELDKHYRSTEFLFKFDVKGFGGMQPAFIENGIGEVGRFVSMSVYDDPDKKVLGVSMDTPDYVGPGFAMTGRTGDTFFLVDGYATLRAQLIQDHREDKVICLYSLSVDAPILMSTLRYAGQTFYSGRAIKRLRETWGTPEVEHPKPLYTE